jgi:hypothetical protein
MITARGARRRSIGILPFTLSLAIFVNAVRRP